MERAAAVLAESVAADRIAAIILISRVHYDVNVVPSVDPERRVNPAPLGLVDAVAASHVTDNLELSVPRGRSREHQYRSETVESQTPSTHTVPFLAM